jgi:hypothetical protein
MAHGGSRSGAGRKSKRPLNQELAARILEKAKEEEKWLDLLEAPDLRIRLDSLKYLTDRRDGKATQKHIVDGNLSIDLAARRERIRELISRLAGKA